MDTIPEAASSLALEGVGIHTGVPCRVAFSLRGTEPRGDSLSGEGRAGAPQPGGRAVRFLLPSASGGTRRLDAGELAGLPRAARRATVLGDGAESLRTPEHLLAALLFFADAPLDVACEGGEIPNLDGSALPFREALAALSPGRTLAPGWREYPTRLRWDREWDGGWIRVRPSSRFAVTYTWERCGLSETVRVDSPGQAWHDILPARTWITRREWHEARRTGLAKGGGEGAGLLLAETPEEHAAARRERPEWDGPFPLLTPSAYRLPAEPARHKILDLLGDLALHGLELPSAEIGIKNGGHGVNHELLARLRD